MLVRSRSSAPSFILRDLSGRESRPVKPEAPGSSPGRRASLGDKFYGRTPVSKTGGRGSTPWSPASMPADRTARIPRAGLTGGTPSSTMSAREAGDYFVPRASNRTHRAANPTSARRDTGAELQVDGDVGEVANTEVCDSSIRGFNSRTSPHFAPVAQRQCTRLVSGRSRVRSLARSTSLADSFNGRTLGSEPGSAGSIPASASIFPWGFALSWRAIRHRALTPTRAVRLRQPLPLFARSSSGSGRRPLKAEVGGQHPYGRPYTATVAQRQRHRV